MGRVVGIDLGTTNSAVAVLEGGAPIVIANAEGSRTTPSVVAFTNDGKTLTGSVAKRQAVTNVDRTISSVKRHMGTSWHTEIDGKKYTAEEINARILMKLKADAETYLGEEVTEAVITVPAYYNDEQRKATQDAGRIAGLKVLRIINEPTAAALAYGLEKADSDEKILVYDLGGGTFDVSLLEVSNDDGFATVEVIATSGDNKLGGDDWDNRIMEWIFAEFKKEHNVDLSVDKIARQRVQEAAETAKKEISATAETTIQLPYISMSPEGPLSLELTLTQANFEGITQDLLERTRKPLEAVLKDSKLNLEDIDHVVLVGGSTRMPAVTALVEKISGKQANKTVNPDEVVALGAAVQGGILSGEVKDVLLIDVTPLTLGIRTGSDNMTAMISRNTAIPTQKTEIFTTSADNQPVVAIAVSQGERPVFSGNKKLGEFELKMLPALAGKPQIQVAFSIDANGVLDVTAKDLGTGKENKVTISGGGNLSDDEIEKMMKDAEAHASEDEQKVKEIEAFNSAQRLINQTKQTLEDFADSIPEDLKTKLESESADLKAKAEAKDFQGTLTGTEKLSATLSSIGDAVYQSAPETETNEEDNLNEANDGEDVIDAEVVDAEIVE